MSRRTTRTGITAVWLMLLGACSSQELYLSGQQWQRQECHKLQDADQRSRCLASTARSYDDYQRESAAARAAR
jgi:hypothetical protein